jgi:hypothetical protein
MLHVDANANVHAWERIPTGITANCAKSTKIILFQAHVIAKPEKSRLKAHLRKGDCQPDSLCAAFRVIELRNSPGVIWLDGRTVAGEELREFFRGNPIPPHDVVVNGSRLGLARKGDAHGDA